MEREGQGVQVGVGEQGFGDVLIAAGYQAEHPAGQAGGRELVGQPPRDQRCLGAGLSTTAFPAMRARPASGRGEQRIVPRGDREHHPDGLAAHGGLRPGARVGEDLAERLPGDDA